MSGYFLTHVAPHRVNKTSILIKYINRKRKYKNLKYNKIHQYKINKIYQYCAI